MKNPGKRLYTRQSDLLLLISIVKTWTLTLCGTHIFNNTCQTISKRYRKEHLDAFSEVQVMMKYLVMLVCKRRKKDVTVFVHSKYFNTMKAHTHKLYHICSVEDKSLEVNYEMGQSNL